MDSLYSLAGAPLAAVCLLVAVAALLLPAFTPDARRPAYAYTVPTSRRRKFVKISLADAQLRTEPAWAGRNLENLLLPSQRTTTHLPPSRGAAGPTWTTASATSAAVDVTPKRRVAVTGANGMTGSLVLAKLMSSHDFTATAVVRSAKAARALRRQIADRGPNQIFEFFQFLKFKNDNNKDDDDDDDDDVRIEQADFSTSADPTLVKAFRGCSALVICTSAKPRLLKRSMLTVLWRKIRYGDAKFTETAKFEYEKGGSPKEVDCVGQMRQIDAAIAAGVEHIVVVSSMSGTQLGAENFLNSIGRKEDGTGGDIVFWKRQAEMYLKSKTNISHTIIHPGGLRENKNNVIVRRERLVLGVDDKLLNDKTRRTLERDDVAMLCVASLRLPAARGLSLDCVTYDDDPALAVEQAVDSVRPSIDAALAQFAASGASCAYPEYDDFVKLMSNSNDDFAAVVDAMAA